MAASASFKAYVFEPCCQCCSSFLVFSLSFLLCLSLFEITSSIAILLRTSCHLTTIPFLFLPAPYFNIFRHRVFLEDIFEALLLATRGASFSQFTISEISRDSSLWHAIHMTKPSKSTCERTQYILFIPLRFRNYVLLTYSYLVMLMIRQRLYMEYVYDLVVCPDFWYFIGSLDQNIGLFTAYPCLILAWTTNSWS